MFLQGVLYRYTAIWSGVQEIHHDKSCTPRALEASGVQLLE